MRPSKVRDT
uniref:Uncharacterized protein n=1 Tax=Arundo donax TaxID=35708 RepID=A0A0A8YS99_ARUDO